jgi:hypothetical protein
MEVIFFQDEAFYKMVETVVQRMKDKQQQKGPKWLSNDEAMELLHVKSKTTMQKLRDEGKVRFSQPEKKIILYDADSLQEYLSQNVKETF